MSDMSELRHIFPFFIPILGIVMGIGIGMLALWLDYQKKTRIFELHHKERLLAIERGMEVPPLPLEFFQGRSRAASYLDSNLRWGLIWLLAGLALAVALLLNGDAEAAAWALLPIAIGAAQLIFYSIGRRDKPQADTSAPAKPTAT